MVDVKFYTDRAKRTLVKLAENISDLRPVWKNLIDYYQNEIIPAAWSTKGKIMEGKRWTPLSKKYNKWKKKNYPGQPLMYRTGKLLEAATGGPGWMQKINRRNMEMGVEGQEYFYHVSERSKYGRKYFYTSENSLPARAWAWLIADVNKFIEAADDK